MAVMKRFGVAGVLCGIFVVVLLADGGMAQVPATAPADRRLDDIEKQIRALQDLVKDLRAPATQRAVAAATGPSTAPVGDDPVSRIRDEGMNRSQVMATLSYLTDVIGPRLTASPNLKRANEWTRDRMVGWGMANAQVEPWGTFG